MGNSACLVQPGKANPDGKFGVLNEIAAIDSKSSFGGFIYIIFSGWRILELIVREIEGIDGSPKKRNNSFMKFSVYPSGDKSIEGKDHISLYLEIVETSSLPTGWEVNAIFNLFLFDQIRDKFISFEGNCISTYFLKLIEAPQGEAVQKRTRGYASAVSIEAHTSKPRCTEAYETHASVLSIILCIRFAMNFMINIYEVLFYAPRGAKGKRLDARVRRFHTMKPKWGFARFMDLQTFNNPSNGYLVNDTCKFGAEIFMSKRHQKSIVFYPNGQSNEKSNNNCCVVGLALDSTLPPDTSLFVHLMCRMRDQKYANHFRKTDSKTFSSKSLARGFEDYMSLTKLNDPENGFLRHQ
ncbi:hypothetical protein F8388_020081 [Cannabis sativa]|uniref:MATH domain-containing protein n=1 Tax=Cannabis sativa TaxID=3483 RepID=A0A7J6FA12_CANSA|nr:hypothetical protein F8388_020081 [Cannabis sativa]